MANAMQEDKPSEAVPVEVFRAQFRKTRLCRYFNEGLCRNGVSCEFAHGDAELSPAPDVGKTSMCKKWLAGKCTSDECNFAHGPDQLRPAPMFLEALMPDRERKKSSAKAEPTKGRGKQAPVVSKAPATTHLPIPFKLMSPKIPARAEHMCWLRDACFAETANTAMYKPPCKYEDSVWNPLFLASPQKIRKPAKVSLVSGGKACEQLYGNFNGDERAVHNLGLDMFNSPPPWVQDYIYVERLCGL